jgi:hypothetical protein
MALVYGINPQTEKKRYAEWLATHQPFHWFAEFYQIIALNGGFDVVIGNPPYVAMGSIGYKLLITDYKCSDLFAYVIRRCFQILNKQSRYGCIVMHNLAFSKHFKDARTLIKNNAQTGWFSFFARIPAGLFSGDVRVRNCVFVLERNENTKTQQFFTTRIHRWFTEVRESLFAKINFAHFIFNDAIPMYNDNVLADYFENAKGKALANYEDRHSGHTLYFKQSAYNWIAVSKKPAPCFDGGGKKIPQTKVGTICFHNADNVLFSLLFLNGKLFFSRWFSFGDEFDVTKDDLLSTVVPFDVITDEDKQILKNLAKEFSDKLDGTIQYKLNAGKKVGTYNTSKLWYITDKSDKIFLK